MTPLWLQPQAWWGLAVLAIPVAIHLLARHRSRQLPFPSLRFLPTARLAALRRRVISDWPLLIVRVLLLAVVVAALAAPVFVSDARRATWNTRVARAVIVWPDLTAASEVVAEEARGSFTSSVFAPSTLGDGLQSAEIWLTRQPPAAREIVIAGDLREGAIHSADLAALDRHVGIRFRPNPARDALATTAVRAVTDVGDGSISLYDVRVSAAERHTTASFAPSTAKPSPQIVVRASAADQAQAEAVLRAVLREGVMSGRDMRRAVTIVFPGAPAVGSLAVPSASWARDVLEQLPAAGGELTGVLFVQAPMAATETRAAAFVSRVADLVFAVRFEAHEPRRIAPALLAQWSRPPGPSPDSALPADEGDRRFLWSAALILLGVEQLLRRSRRLVAAGNAPVAEEARVA